MCRAAVMFRVGVLAVAGMCVVWLGVILVPGGGLGEKDVPMEIVQIDVAAVGGGVERPQTELEKGIVEVIEALQMHKNITLWPVGGTLIHLMRHGRFSDYEEHDQEFDLDLALGINDDRVNFTQESRQWVVDVLAAKGVLRHHKLTGKKSQAGTGTCRNRKDNFIQCKHLSLQLKFDFFLGKPSADLSEVFYAPLGFQPRKLLYPTKRCRAWHLSVACPAQPYAMLKVWGVHTGYETKEGCLLFPRHLQKLAANPRGLPLPEKAHLQRETVSLIRKAETLDAGGYVSFATEIKTDDECRRVVAGILNANSSVGLHSSM